MKSSIKHLLLSCLVFFISGCENLLETEVKLSQLQSKQHYNIKGNLYVEVAACDDSSDSRIESRSIKESKETIPTIFKDAIYVECFRKDFNSYAHFIIPIIINNYIMSNDYIHIITNDKIASLGLSVPSSIANKINRTVEKSFRIADFKLDVKIKFINDTNDELPVVISSVYLDDKPYASGETILNKQSSYMIKLSDVSIDSALKNSYSLVLFKKH